MWNWSGTVDIWDKWFNVIGTKQHQFHAYLSTIGETKELKSALGLFSACHRQEILVQMQ